MMVDDNLNLRQLASIYDNGAAVAAGGGISGYESTTIFGMLAAIAVVALHQPAAVARRCVRTPKVAQKLRRYGVILLHSTYIST
nr:hypothetical protein Itr_chr15CG11250 [Ipomoea trifida]